MALASNMTTVKISSEGAWQGESPLNYALPLLIVQIVLILAVSRSLAFILKPLRQPKVVAEIAGGIALGPSALGRCKPYLSTIFPSWSSPILETTSNLGLLFFIFLVGLELDLAGIRRCGRRAFAIAAAGILLPFLSGAGVVALLRRTAFAPAGVGFLPLLVFMGVALSITALAVLARILAELKLLTTAVGETAMAAAAFNDLAAWVLLGLAIALAGGERHNNPLVTLWILLSGALLVIFMMTVVRPLMQWIDRQYNRGVSEFFICLTLAGVLVSGFLTDLIGIHSIFGAFVFGLTIPKEGKFAGRLFEAIEDFVSGLLLPLYFASNGLKADVTKIKGVEAWGLLALVIAVACMGKVVGTFLVAVWSKIPAREAAALGVLMGTKGLVELIVLNIGKEKKVLNDETFTILVLMALFTTFITTPTVMAIYKPSAHGRRLQTDASVSSPSSMGRRDLRILVCLQGVANVPSVIILVEAIGGSEGNRLKLFVMQMLELTDRPSAIFTALRVRRNGRPAHDPPPMAARIDGGRVMGAFEVYERLGRVKIRVMTAISALNTMHEDVCHVAEEKRVALVLLPFHKGEVVALGDEWGEVNQRVLAHAPCSVGLLVDRGLGSPTKRACGVCVLFFGGPDDREAVELGATMMRNPRVKVTVIRITAQGNNRQQYEEKQKEQDDEAVAEFQRRSEGCAVYEERRVGDVVEGVLEIGRSGDFELLVVGRCGRPSKVAVGNSADWLGEHAELGQIGSILASEGCGVVSSVLVVQQHSTVPSNATSFSICIDGEEGKNMADLVISSPA